MLLVPEEGKTVGEVARDLDLVPSALGKWLKQARTDRGVGPPAVMTSSEKEELARLRAENRTFRMKREIPRKAAAAFFAKENT